MTLILTLAAVALLGTVLTVFLHPVSPVFAVFVSLTCVMVLFLCVLEPLRLIIRDLSHIMTSAGLDGELYLPVLKAVGIAVLVRIVSALCRDAGQGALAVKLELAGTVASIAVCIPLVQQVFALIAAILG